MIRAIVIAICCIAPGKAASREALDWLTELSNHVGQMRNHVIAAWTTSQLAAIACSADQHIGSTLYRTAISRMRNLPDDAFDNSPTPLPVGSFSALWKLTVPSAIKCDPEAVASDERTNWKLTAERGRIDIWLRGALEAEDPSRAAELIDTVLSVAEPGFVLNPLGEILPARAADTLKTLAANREYPVDLAKLTQALIQLRTNEPDLADKCFQKLIDFVIATPPVPIARLDAIGSYLFTSPKDVSLPEPNFATTVVMYPNQRLPERSFMNLMALRLSANPQAQSSYLAAAVSLLHNPESSNRDPLNAYALAYCLEPFAPAELDPLISSLEARLGVRAQAIRGLMGARGSFTSLPLNADGRHDYDLVGRIRAEINAGRFDSVRDLEKHMEDDTLRSRVSAIGTFAEAANLLRSKQYQRSLQLAVELPSGLKRTLLYTGFAVSSDRTAASEAAHLALKESETLSGASKVCALSAIASIEIANDIDGAWQTFKDALGAANDGYQPGNDVVRCSVAGLSEAIETPSGRQSFELRLPYVSVFTIESLIPQAAPLGFSRVEEAVSQLRNELVQARAMISLARLRMSIP